MQPPGGVVGSTAVFLVRSFGAHGQHIAVIVGFVVIVAAVKAWLVVDATERLTAPAVGVAALGGRGYRVMWNHLWGSVHRVGVYNRVGMPTMIKRVYHAWMVHRSHRVLPKRHRPLIRAEPVRRKVAWVLHHVRFLVA